MIPPRSICVLKVEIDEIIEHAKGSISKTEINENLLIAYSLCKIQNNNLVANLK